MTNLPINNTPKLLSKTFTGSVPTPITLNCKQHGEFIGKTWQIPGLKRPLFSHCPTCQALNEQKEQEVQQRRLRDARQAKFLQLLGHSGMPERFISRTFENYHAATPEQQHILQLVRHYAEHFDERLAQGGGLVLSGRPGTGKTHLAAAIANHIMRQGRSVLFLSVLRALRFVKESYQRGSCKTEQQAIDELIKPDLLILDEIGMQFGSETEKLILFEILNGRYEQMLPTILISNLTDSELIHYIGLRCYDRLQEGGGISLSFTWESYRKQVQLEAKLQGKGH